MAHTAIFDLSTPHSWLALSCKVVVKACCELAVGDALTEAMLAAMQLALQLLQVQHVLGNYGQV